MEPSEAGDVRSELLFLSISSTSGVSGGLQKSSMLGPAHSSSMVSPEVDGHSVYGSSLIGASVVV